MTERAQEIITLALALEVSERREVITELMASLDDDRLHSDWSQEILCRLRGIEDGVEAPIPWTKVREGLLDKSHRAS